MFVGPGGEDAQPVVGGGVGLGGPEGELLVGVSGAGQRLPVEGEITDDGVMQGFGAGALAGDVVSGPPSAELGVQHGQLADQRGQLRVVGILGGFPAQQRDAGAGDGFLVPRTATAWRGR